MSEAHRNTRFDKWDSCNKKNELVMDLAKTKAQVAQVREKPTRLQIIGGLQDLHKDTTPINFSSSLRDLQELLQ